MRGQSRLIFCICLLAPTGRTWGKVVCVCADSSDARECHTASSLTIALPSFEPPHLAFLSLPCLVMPLSRLLRIQRAMYRVLDRRDDLLRSATLA
ncbi:hypothetical protein CCHR01_08879 [Colletotrichum chrysophilum]|uniref:Secreted protein n=1 Tax=Colletotrichum chrysophilum TaxID=1836956 RepID=A0AAD9AI52_9PEZI|nr:hypothetical protein CCHR01_08879 [Colletotrichum chrysophilum]